ncbi:MAG: NAD(P)/FAD-dependent oxidoreductase [Acidimicrobiales bacterium]
MTTIEPTAVEHVDVLVVGAGISGIGAAYHLLTQRPGTSFVVLEAFETFGGTWHMHRYPGIRSDSDLYTFGYRFKPWTGAPIATAEEILKYMSEVIEENGLGEHIRYGHRITSATWSSDTSRWTVEVARADQGDTVTFTTSFLWMCQGYYRHAEGYTPTWPGMERYRGQVVHPQTWPEDLDLRGKRVLVIGSGATTATLVPAIAGDCEHVTVLQRSPTYFWPGQNTNELADTLRELDVPEEWTHEIVRRKILHDQQMMTQACIAFPDLAKQELIKGVRDLLPEGYDVETHFTPRYRPWQQRLAFVPDGDLFAGIKAGQASMVTDEIDAFTETGVRTKSGELIDADIVVTATGFNLSVMGDVPFVVDGAPVSWPDTVTYRGMMFTGVPNMVWVFGYFRASWTLRVDLICDLVCRLLDHMHELGATRVMPTLRADDGDMPIQSWIDPDNFNPGYLQRSMDALPKRGDKPEWQHTQDYWWEKDALPAVDLDDGCLRYQ